MRLVKEVVEARMPKGILLELGCLWHPAAPWGRFRVAAIAQLREIAAEKETTCKKKPRGGFIRGGRN